MSMLGGLISGGLGLIGDYFSGREASRQTSRHRDWQEKMANTAHQREVADLRAAGLNPILSATGGSGAATPSGAVAPVPDYGRTLTQASALALQRKVAEAEIANKNASTQLTNKQATGVDINNAAAQAALDYLPTRQYQETRTFEETMNNMGATYQQIRMNTGSTAKDIQAKQQDFERLQNEANWLAKNAPSEWQRQLFGRVANLKGSAGDNAYALRELGAEITKILGGLNPLKRR